MTTDLGTRCLDALRRLHEQGRIASPWLLGMSARPVLEDGTIQDVEGTVVDLSHGMPVVWWPDLRDTREHHPYEHLQIVLDPATLGCLLALVREAYRDPLISVRYVGTLGGPGRGWDDGPWEVVSTSRHTSWGLAEGATEAEALVAALEALAEVTRG